jgi:hypothetical protein
MDTLQCKKKTLIRRSHIYEIESHDKLLCQGILSFVWFHFDVRTWTSAIILASLLWRKRTVLVMIRFVIASVISISLLLFYTSIMNTHQRSTRRLIIYIRVSLTSESRKSSRVFLEFWPGLWSTTHAALITLYQYWTYCKGIFLIKH